MAKLDKILDELEQARETMSIKANHKQNYFNEWLLYLDSYYEEENYETA